MKNQWNIVFVTVILLVLIVLPMCLRAQTNKKNNQALSTGSGVRTYNASQIRLRIDLSDKNNATLLGKPRGSMYRENNTSATKANINQHGQKTIPTDGLIGALINGYANHYFKGYSTDTLTKTMSFASFNQLYGKLNEIPDFDIVTQNNDCSCWVNEIPKIVDLLEVRAFNHTTGRETFSPKFIVVYSGNSIGEAMPLIAFRYEDVEMSILNIGAANNTKNDATTLRIRDIINSRQFTGIILQKSSLQPKTLNESEKIRTRAIEEYEYAWQY